MIVDMETINHEAYVSLEVAKLLKEAGFDWKVRYMYRNNNPILHICTETSYRNTPKPNKCPMYWQYAAPALDVAQRWLREAKNMSVEVLFEKPGKWSCGVILDTNKGVSFENFWREEFDYDIYEQALEAGIKKALEVILDTGE